MNAQDVFLSTLRAGRRDRRVAWTVVLASVVVFVATVPFARTPLAPVWAFIPIYESFTVINDLITALMLLGQFRIVGSRGLLVLASGYLFTAFIAITHALTFPGLFSATGLLGADPQSTAWLYMFWHGGFPLFVIAYAWSARPPDIVPLPRGAARRAVLASVASVLLLAAVLTWLATAGSGLLPPIMRGNAYTASMLSVVTSTWALSLLALGALWERGRRRPHSVLDLWVMVVMTAWLFDIALAAVLNAGRFDVGFYAGRIYGALAASFVLVMLLLENGWLYASLVDAHAAERAARRRAEQAAASAMREVSERTRAEQRFHDLLDSAPDAMVIVAGDGRIVLANREAQTMFGYELADLIGQPIEILIPVRHHARHRRHRDDYLADPRTRPMGVGLDLLARRRDGSEFPVEISLSPLKEPDETLVSAVVRDVTERKRLDAHIGALNENLARRVAELDAANRELEAFSYSVSHDLRAPLRSIDGFSQAVLEEYGVKLDDQGADYLRRVRAAAVRMGVLIDDLLALSAVTRRELRQETTDLSAIARAVGAQLEQSRLYKPVHLVVEDGVHATGDPHLLRIVLDNLLGNAWKFSSKAEAPRVEFGARALPDGSRAVFVSDNGVGFDMAYADKLFGAFQRLHASRDFPGTGIGLATVQRIVTRHGGRVWAESTPGRGATFFVTLPPAR